MSKKILIVSSTPRKNGNSLKLAQQFMKGAVEAGHEVEFVNLAEKNIHCCLACGACRKNGGTCVQRDDIPAIIQKLLEADVLVMASPVYYDNVSAQLKIFMDRTYAVTRNVHDKEAYFLLTCGAGDESGAVCALNAFHGFIRMFKNIHNAGEVLGLGAYSLGDIDTHPAMQEAYEMGLKA